MTKSFFTSQKEALSAISLLTISFLFTLSCTKEPTASFTYAPDYNLEAGETIKFYNKSIDATEYQWDFGNGETSIKESPTTVYPLVGDYIVSLVSTNSKATAVDSQFITIHEPTILMLLILEPDGETPLVNCKTKVYDSEDNLINDVNPVYWDNTDIYGIATFYNVETIPYYARAYKDVHFGVYELMGWVPTIELNKLNVFYGISYYTPNGEKKGSSMRPIVREFKKQEP